MYLTKPLSTFLLLASFAFLAASAATSPPSTTQYRRRNHCFVNRFKPNAIKIVEENSLAKVLGVQEVKELQREVCKDGNCNTRLCFALDGSASVSSKEFQVQKDLVTLLASIAAPHNATFSAVQYGLSNTAITSSVNSSADFTELVQKSVLQRATRTFLSAGIGFCISQLVQQAPGAGRKIIVLGDGRANFGETSLPIVLAAKDKADIYAVGIGFPRDAKRLLQITGGNRARVFGVSRYSDLFQKNIIFKMARALCNVKPVAPKTA